MSSPNPGIDSSGITSPDIASSCHSPMHAAIAIFKNSNHQIYLQRRRLNQSYSGYWEFPGGKIKKQENPKAAIVREIKEEIGLHLDIDTINSPWVVINPPHRHIKINVFKIDSWQGIIDPCEQQQGLWCPLDVKPIPLLPANHCLWKWLRLPSVCAISAAELIGVAHTINALPKLLKQGVRLFQLRDKNLSTHDRQQLAQAMLHIITPYDGILLINDDEHLATTVNAHGIHLSSKKLMTLTQKPIFEWVGASCHNQEQLNKAQKLGIDFAVFSPICKTLTHVNDPPIGWQSFAQLIDSTTIPVYALGGLSWQDLNTAKAHGAQGIAMMRQSWS